MEKRIQTVKGRKKLRRRPAGQCDGLNFLHQKTFRIKLWLRVVGSRETHANFTRNINSKLLTLMPGTDCTFVSFNPFGTDGYSSTATLYLIV